ncbi:MAG: hypothetical protein RR768_03600 [Clostridium sp.]
MMDTDYRLERRLATLDSDLHRRYKDCVLTSQTMLTHYQRVFPTFTDHTVLHTLNVINYCNQLIGDQIDRLTADDIYVLLMGCLFHDVGMGISREYYEHFKLQLDTPPSAQALDKIIRNSHHEFSAMYLKKYWRILDIPDETYLFAIMQVCRGHRKVDLMNEENYPSTYRLIKGDGICLPYLAAILRLADELDVAADRNISFLYDIDQIKNPIDHMWYSKNLAIRTVDLSEHTITLYAQSDDSVIRSELVLIREEIEENLRYCRMVAASRSEFVITQQTVRLVMNNAK